MKRLVLVLPFLLLLFHACSKKSPTSNAVLSKFIVAEFEVYQQYMSYFRFTEQVEVYSDPAPDLTRCSVQMKFGDISLYPAKKEQRVGGVQWNDTLHFPYPGVDCSLYVNTDVGLTRGGNVSTPGGYRITTPTYYDSMPLGDVRISWSKAQGGSWYDLYLSFTANGSQGYLGDGDTILILAETTAVIPLGFFAKYGPPTFVYAFAQLNAHNGAMPGPGGVANLSGDIKGVFFSTFSDTGGRRFFRMFGSQPQLSLPLPREISEAQRRLAILRAFGVPVK